MGRYHTTEKQIQEMLDELEAAKNSNGKKRWTRKRILHVISQSVFTIVFCSMLFLIFDIWKDKINNETPSILGYQLYRVETGSMIPTFPIGSMIISKEYDGVSDLSVDDVVTFYMGDKIVTHRIVEVMKENGETTYHTKGDNPENSIDPDILVKENIVAIYKWSLPFIIQSNLIQVMLYE